MNAGLSNLVTLKAKLLPSTWTSVTTEDDIILALGLGIAGLFEGFCGRKFQRVADDTFECDANTASVQLVRTPVESVTTLEIQADFGDAFEDITSCMRYVSQGGVVRLGYPPATEPGSTLRFTYTGGYWWDTEEDNSGELPAGATAIHATLQTAWFMQCKAVYAMTSQDAVKAGLDSGNLDALKSLITGSELLPGVKQMLQQFRILAA